MPPLYETDDDCMARAVEQIALDRLRQQHPVKGTVGYYDDPCRVWCFDCKRSIDRAKNDTIYQKCPYCGSEKIPFLRDPLLRMSDVIDGVCGTLRPIFEKGHPKDA